MSFATLPPTRRLAPASAFALVAAVIGLALFASATPSPLYGVYQARWHFSTPVLTLVYAVYAFGVLAALLLAGRLSDELGRRPVLIGALSALMIATGLFAVADSIVWLFAARGLQGLATGAALGAAGAALLDLHPTGDARRAALVNGTVSAFGIGAGALIASALVQYLPAPLLTPYLLLLALFAVVLLGACALPESATLVGRPRLRAQPPRVPRAIRGPFALAALGVLASWSIGGVYLALGPALAAGILHTTNHLAGGGAVFALSATGALVQLRFHRLDALRATWVGALLLGTGMTLTAESLSTGSAVFFLGASALTGAGFGLAFMGGLRSLSVVVPEHHRGEVMSAFYIVAYCSLSLPAVAAGIAVPQLGLEATFRIFSAAVVLLAIVVVVVALRSVKERPSGADILAD